MNQRIRDLAEQAGAHYLDVKNEATAMVNIEAFAELIVRECADVAGKDVRHFVLAHFGLKECGK